LFSSAYAWSMKQGKNVADRAGGFSFGPVGFL